MLDWPDRERREYNLIIALEVRKENADFRRAQARGGR
jgi:hypothetical protein